MRNRTRSALAALLLVSAGAPAAGDDLCGLGDEFDDLDVFDLAGRRDAFGRPAPAGVYLFRLESKGSVAARKTALVR